MKKGLLIAVCGIFLLTVGCKTAQNTQTATSEKTVNENKGNLEGSWELVSITTPETTGKTLKDLFPNKTPMLIFETKEQRVYGNDGCNNLTGTYENQKGNEIKIGDKMASTMMFCQGVADAAFMEGLRSVTNFDVNDNELLFISGDIVVMKFAKQQK